MFKSSMFRRIGAVVSAGTLLKCSYADASVPFDTKGLPTSIVPPTFPSIQCDKASCPPLHLAGVGMRRKNLYLFEVDVYIVGLRVSESILKLRDPTVDFLETVKHENDKTLVGQHVPKISITCKFVRAVTTSQIIDAFNESLLGLDEVEIGKFRDVMHQAIGSNGCKSGEEVVFYWLSGGGLVVVKSGSVGGVVNFEPLERRLLEVYLEKDKSVSPQLIKCLQDHIHQVQV